MRKQPALLLLLLLQPYRVFESRTEPQFSRADSVDKPEFIMLEALSVNLGTFLVFKYRVGTKPAFPDGSKITAVDKCSPVIPLGVCRWYLRRHRTAYWPRSNSLRPTQKKTQSERNSEPSEACRRGGICYLSTVLTTASSEWLNGCT